MVRIGSTEYQFPHEPMVTLDKLERTKYYVSPEGIAQQIPIIKEECTTAGTPFYGETGDISNEVINAFKERKPFARSICESYEDYMVNFMARIFEIEDAVLLREIVETGFISIILGYLWERRVDPAKIDPIQDTVFAYIETYGIS